MPSVADEATVSVAKGTTTSVENEAIVSVTEDATPSVEDEVTVSVAEGTTDSVEDEVTVSVAGCVAFSAVGVSVTVRKTEVTERGSKGVGVAGIIMSTLTFEEVVGRNPTSSLCSIVFTPSGVASTVLVTAEAGAVAFFLGDRTLPIVYK